MSYLEPGHFTNPGALEFDGNPNYTIADIGTLETDRYGLSTCRAVYQINLSDSNNWSLLPGLYSYHPIWSFAQCEHQSMAIRNGFAIATCDYAGLNPNIQLTPVYELAIGLSDQPITTHPKFVSAIGGTATEPLNGAIFEHYANDGSVDSIAPPATPADNTNWLFKAFALFNNDGSQNPFASIEEFLAATEVTWRASTTIIAVENFSGMETAGKIAIPQGPIPAVPQDGAYNWLDMGVNGVQRGSAFAINHEWRLSGPRGWNSTIYGS